MEKRVSIVKVVTRNFILDFFANIQNIFGSNLTSYEKMVEKAIAQIETELKEKEIKLEWYRYEITQLTNGAVAILLYGDSK